MRCAGKECVYRRGGVDVSSLVYGGCSYIDIVGKSKLVAIYKLLGVNKLKAAERRCGGVCPMYLGPNGETKPILPVGKMGEINGIDMDRAVELWKKGLWDTAIARELGVSQKRISQALRAAGCRGNRAKRACLHDWELGERLYKEGKTDSEIAKALGCTASTVGSWRDKRELPPNDRRRRIDRERLRELWTEGKTDSEIAAELGCTRCTVENIKREMGLRLRKKYRDEDMMELYQSGLRDRVMAEILGVSQSTVWNWRTRRRLPPNTGEEEED